MSHTAIGRGFRNFINYLPYEPVTLTSEGEKAARDVMFRHMALKDFFTNVLDIEEKMAETAACSMEHALPREIVDKLMEFALSMRKTQTIGMPLPVGGG